MLFKENIYRLAIPLTILLFGGLLSACSEDDSDDNGPSSSNKTSGFVFVGATSSESVLVKYVEELPTGTLDLSDGTDFPRFVPTSVYDHALFLVRPDNSSGFAKYVVNSEGQLIEEGAITAQGENSFRIDVRDAQTGVFQDRATPDQITVFNPTTFTVTNTIDMSEGFVPGDADQRYQRFIFQDDDVFMPVRGNVGAQSFPSLVIHQANLATNAFVGSTQRDGNGVNTILTVAMGQNLTDDQGNLYIPDGGNYDGAGIPAAINRIPAGSNTFDDTYTFYPAVVLNPANTFLPTANSFDIIGGSQAIARVNAETPQAAIDIVVGAGGVQNLSDAQEQQVLQILFTAESARWCVLDLEAQTVSPIEGIPAVGIFAGGTVFRHDGALYIPAPTSSEGAYYRYDPSTGVAEKAFVITGADIQGAFNIANDN
ncbi:hypothetical protein [Tunicatimonas pelagia]|uniref:hypothetical protein n=1 Tax=Tunicatimonas pelagia TaxID=931531 RepID=UPI002664E5FD|nr:hypothetical protein [Tunicatimonas pelagia]WKN42996.1 hypothetical protein P0M28_28560 [Tunicatimonas pelagia]